MNPPKIGLPYGIFGPWLSVSQAYGVNVVNTVLFEVPGFSVTINNVLWSLLGGVAATHAGFGIYAVTPGSLTRGARLADTGPLPTLVANQGVNTSPFLAPVTLACGIYCMAFTSDSAATTFSGVLSAGENINILNVYNLTPEGFVGTAANAAAAGQLPPTLGVITPVGAAKFPVSMLSN